MKKLVIAAIVVMLLAGSISSAAAAADVRVLVDGRTVSFPDQRPFVDANGRTLVPLRFVAQEMGADVQWLEADQSVLIEKSQDEKPLIGGVRSLLDFQNLLREARNFINRTLISLRIGENRARVNDRDVTFDTRPVIVGGRTMVPLRFISETLGANVEWDGKTRTVSIWTGGAAKAVTPFVGVPTRAEDWRNVGRPADLRWENPTVKYITIADLPHELDTRSILGITIDQRHINVTIKGRQNAPTMFLAEGNDIRRKRGATNVTAELGSDVWVQSYNLQSAWDVHPDLANIGSRADITKITHFVFRGLGESGTVLLAVENPLYGGGR